MTPEQIGLLRRLALNDTVTVSAVMGGDTQGAPPLDPRQASLIRLALLLGSDADESAYRWAIDTALAAGVEDEEIVSAVVLVAPIVGTARLNSSLPRLLDAMDLDLIDH